MVEETITDGLGNFITLRYNDENDQVTIKNTGIDGEFRIVYLNPAMLVPDNVITIEGINGPEQWEGFTDNTGRNFIGLFWGVHKIDKETRGL
jgi:hypothetical protein